MNDPSSQDAARHGCCCSACFHLNHFSHLSHWCFGGSCTFECCFKRAGFEKIFGQCGQGNPDKEFDSSSAVSSPPRPTGGPVTSSSPMDRAGLDWPNGRPRPPRYGRPRPRPRPPLPRPLPPAVVLLSGKSSGLSHFECAQ